MRLVLCGVLQHVMLLIVVSLQYLLVLFVDVWEVLVLGVVCLILELDSELVVFGELDRLLMCFGQLFWVLGLLHGYTVQVGWFVFLVGLIMEVFVGVDI